MSPGTKPANFDWNSNLAISPIPNSSFWDILLWLLRQRRRFQVFGISMLPLLKPGDEILVDCSSYRLSNPSIGDVVVVKSPENPNLNLVKRVVSIEPNGSCFLQGDNRSHSTDSWDFGWVESHLIVGRVTSRFF